MENTKDLVRAERSSRFVCQVGGGGDACHSGTPLAGLFLLPTPPPSPELPSPYWPFNVQGVPLPPQPLTWGSLKSLGKEKKTYEKKVFLCPSPAPFWLRRKSRWETFPFLAAKGGRVVSSLLWGVGAGADRVSGLCRGRNPLEGGQCREAFCTWRCCY